MQLSIGAPVTALMTVVYMLPSWAGWTGLPNIEVLRGMT
jgi:hypothetical protein